MRVVVAPDCFTGTLSAVEAADAIATGWRRTDPTGSLDVAPMSDGGPGFVAALYASLGGELHQVEVRGPLGAPTTADVLVAANGTVYVEAAQACGTQLFSGEERHPMEADSQGVGELLASAVRDFAATTVVVGVGGTASTDGGRGCVDRFQVLVPSGWPQGVRLVAATDVVNPLLGSDGAAAVYGPQKGASPEQVRALEDRLRSWAELAGADPTVAGAGAGGGLAYGLMVLGGTRASGVQTVLDAVRLPERAAAADLLLTGEGTFDGTSLQGKVPKGVAWVAQRAGRPCVVLAGRVMVGRREFSAAGVDAAYSIEESAGSLTAALDRPAERLADLAERVARSWVPRA